MDPSLSSIITYLGKTPKIHPTAFIAPGARLIGDIEIGPNSSIWYNCVLRGDVNSIRIGARTNIQDGTVIHVDSPKPGSEAGLPTIIGDDVLIGHMVMLHGSILHDGAFVGLSSVVMDGCTIESDGMLAAGALLSPGKTIASGQLWMGRPAKMLRDLSPEEIAVNRMGAAHYSHIATLHAEAVSG
jgi:carbonic anhydrase/acetyltransferase-like protein (isoleucine patch superfamily)